MNIERADLTLDEMPRNWYNILPDLPEPLPAYKDEVTGKDVKSLPKIYTKAASNMEFSNQKWIKIPDEVLEAYIYLRRPRPLRRAHKLEEFLKTPAKIYYKCEDLPPVGSFKINASIPQAYWAMKEGYKRTIIGTSITNRTKFAHLFASKFFGLSSTIFLPRIQFKNNNDHIFFLKNMLGAKLIESPSPYTDIGRKLLKKNPNHPGNFSIAKQEMTAEVYQNKEAIAIASSIWNHILIVQSIIGLEVEKQLEKLDKKPNILISSVGGGSSFGGLIAPFMRDYLKKKLNDIKFLAIESEVASKLTNGQYKYISMPYLPGLLAKEYEAKASPSQSIMGKGIQAQHVAPIISLLRKLGLIETKVYPKDEKAIYEAAKIFLQTEGRLVAPESAYSVRGAIDEALQAKKTKEEKTIVMIISGTAFLDFGEKQRYISYRD